jgi:hypothetical protein
MKQQPNKNPLHVHRTYHAMEKLSPAQMRLLDKRRWERMSNMELLLSEQSNPSENELALARVADLADTIPEDWEPGDSPLHKSNMELL